MPLYEILLYWHLAGGGILFFAWYCITNRFLYSASPLNPIDIIDDYNISIIGCVILTIIFNLLCPIFTIIYWLTKFVIYIFIAH